MPENTFFQGGTYFDNRIWCFIEGENIFQTDFQGSKVPIGKTNTVYRDLEETAESYLDKFRSLCNMENSDEVMSELSSLRSKLFPKTAAEIAEESNKKLLEAQSTMLEMATMMKEMQKEIKELKQREHKCNCENGADSSPKPENRRSNKPSATND